MSSPALYTQATGSGIVTLFRTLQPAPVYAEGQKLATDVFRYLTPVILAIAVIVRALETQLSQLAGQGRWAGAIRDYFVIGAAIALYFGVVSLLVSVINPFYAYLDTRGGLQIITAQIARVMRSIASAQNASSSQSAGFFAFVQNTVGAIEMLPAYLVYYVSLLLVAAVNAFLRVAHAIMWSFAVIYGLIALPMSVTSNLRLLRGWGTFMGFLVLWPIVEMLFLALFAPMFSGAAQALSATTATAFAVSNTLMLFSCLNLIMLAILVSAPWVAGALATNAPAHLGVVTPFVSAAVAAASGMTRTIERHAPAAAVRLRTGMAAPVPAPTASAMPGGHPVSKPAPAPGAGPTPADPGATPAHRARQARRGAIIRQQQRRDKP